MAYPWPVGAHGVCQDADERLSRALPLIAACESHRFLPWQFYVECLATMPGT